MSQFLQHKKTPDFGYKEQSVRKPRIITTLRDSNAKAGGKSKKVKVSACLIGHYTTETYGGVEVELHSFLLSALVGGECSVSCPSGKAACSHWIGDKEVGPTVLDT
jgi:hypothetical protein